MASDKVEQIFHRLGDAVKISPMIFTLMIGTYRTDTEIKKVRNTFEEFLNTHRTDIRKEIGRKLIAESCNEHSLAYDILVVFVRQFGIQTAWLTAAPFGEVIQRTAITKIIISDEDITISAHHQHLIEEGWSISTEEFSLDNLLMLFEARPKIKLEV